MGKPWFTIETVGPDTFALSEYKHWEETHAYLLLGEKRALLIDTGLGVGDIQAEVEKLTALPVTAATTHVHWDHIGGHRQFADIAVFETEEGWLSGRFPLPPEAVRQNLTRFPCEWPAGFVPDSYRVYQGGANRLLRDGDIVDLGGRQLTVLHTPGHSPGHCCFYEPERGYLFSGDLVYAGCLDAFYPTTDPLLFWRSLRRIKELPVSRLFPGHHRLDIPPEQTARTEAAFASIAAAGRLRQGEGIFEFDGFQIHL